MAKGEEVEPIPNSRGDLFKRVHDKIKGEKLDVYLNRKSPELQRIVEECLGHILGKEELDDIALKYVENFCKTAPYHYSKSKSHIINMFHTRKSYFDAMIPVETMKKLDALNNIGINLPDLDGVPDLPDPPDTLPNDESNIPDALNKVLLENDIASTINDVVVENEVTSATVEFTIPSMQRMVLAQTPPVAAHVTVDVPIVANIEAPIEAPTMDTDETIPDEK